MFFKGVSPIWHSRMIQRAEFWLMEFPCQSLPPPSSFSWAFLFTYAIQFQDSFHWLFVISLQDPSQSLKPKYHPPGPEEDFRHRGRSSFPSVAFDCHWINWAGFQRKHPLCGGVPTALPSNSWWQISGHIYRKWWIFSLQMAYHNKLIPLHVTGNCILLWEGNCMRSMNIWYMDISKQPDLEKIKTALYSQSLRPPHWQDSDFNLLQVAKLRKVIALSIFN